MDDHREFLKRLLKSQSDLRSFICALIRDQHAREDTFQESVLTAWEKFAHFEKQRSFGAWIRGIAARKIMQRRDKLGRQPVSFSPEAVQAVLDAFNRTERTESDRATALDDCVHRLPAHSSKLLKLRYEESLDMTTIADRVGSTMQAVQRALSRVRAKLVECVERRLAAAGESAQ